MTDATHIKTLTTCWDELYGDDTSQILGEFITELKVERLNITFNGHEQEWYKDAIVYSLYVDLFNHNFRGLCDKLDYLEDLGVNCLWLLPVLESPMRDAGFDISNYRKIRSSLLANNEQENVGASQSIFEDFLTEAHNREMKVIFDIAMNHTSDQHFWFQESRKSIDNPYRDYYIWNKDASKYKDARLLFKGMCPSNWEKDGDCYYFHRFFEFQPDLNYRNPKVILEMSRNLIYWLKKGVDGFRADAIPYIWKEDGTSCENLPGTHTVVRFFRAVVEYLRPNTLLLAEACQKPVELIKYLETEDECNAGYHFPLMPQMFKTLAAGNKKPIVETLDINTTPEIPASSQWFTFLRCHDELSLELVYVSEEDRKYIHENYCHQPEWDFRLGEGISARLSELMQRDERRIGVIYSLMLTLPGTPVIYYGDEFGKYNDEAYYQEMIKMTGKDDTRFLVRGKIDWDKLESDLEDKDSFQSHVFKRLSSQIKSRNNFHCFGRGDLRWIEVYNQDGNPVDEVIAYTRNYGSENVLIIQNVSGKEMDILKPDILLKVPGTDMLEQELDYDPEENSIILPPFSYYWIKL